jgi:protein Mpv17
MRHSNRQSLIESNFPASYLVPSSKAVLAASQADEKELDKEEESSEIFESKLSWRNTAIKLVLDQTIGASFNTILFSLTFAGFKGASISESWEIAQRDFLGMILAGWRVCKVP